MNDQKLDLINSGDARLVAVCSPDTTTSAELQNFARLQTGYEWTACDVSVVCAAHGNGRRHSILFRRDLNPPQEIIERWRQEAAKLSKELASKKREPSHSCVRITMLGDTPVVSEICTSDPPSHPGLPTVVIRFNDGDTKDKLVQGINAFLLEQGITEKRFEDARFTIASQLAVRCEQWEKKWK